MNGIWLFQGTTGADIPRGHFCDRFVLHRVPCFSLVPALSPLFMPRSQVPKSKLLTERVDHRNSLTPKITTVSRDLGLAPLFLRGTVTKPNQKGAGRRHDR